MASTRIEFIDLAKGFCILWVVLGHVAGKEILPIPYLGMARMPLYFILSGLFFKDYGSLKNLTLKKINKILIPFLFFYLLGYLCFYLIKWLRPDLLVTDATGIWDVFTGRQYFNGPIWFLLALFWSNIYFCIVSLTIKNEIWRSIAVMALGGLGTLLGKNDIYVPLMMDVALTALPFFYAGYLLKRSGILYPNERMDKFNIPISLAFYGGGYFLVTLFGTNLIGFHYNHIHGNILFSWMTSILFVLSILFLCKTLRYIPGISYFGRYSIIPLCTHHMIYRPLQHLFALYAPQIALWIVPLLTVLLCLACIPLMKRFLPHVTAQKDIIRVDTPTTSRSEKD